MQVRPANHILDDPEVISPKMCLTGLREYYAGMPATLKHKQYYAHSVDKECTVHETITFWVSDYFFSYLFLRFRFYSSS